MLDGRGKARVGDRGDQAQHGVEQEAGALGLCRFDPEALRGRVREPGGQRPGRASEGAGQVVPGEQAGAVAALRCLGEHGLLGREEERHVAGRRVDGAHERDRQQWPEGGDAGEPEAGDDHQGGGAEKNGAAPETVAGETDGQRERRRAEQRSGDDGSDLHGGEPQPGEVAGEEHADHAVRESACAAREEEGPRVARRGGRKHRASMCELPAGRIDRDESLRLYPGRA